MYFVYLASSSPRRRELLTQVGVKFEMLILRQGKGRQDVDETPLPNEAPIDYVQRVARAKADMAAKVRTLRSLPAHPILCADTTVVCNGHILGKPKNADDAKRMLAQLSGRSHVVLTAVVLHSQGIAHCALSQSEIEFCNMSADEIAQYVATGEPMDKAGAYAVQGQAAQFIKRIAGSYSGVMGLPVYETMQLLKNL